MAGLRIPTYPPGVGSHCLRLLDPDMTLNAAGQGFRPKALPGADCLEQEKDCWRARCGPFSRLVLAWNEWETR